MSNTSSTADAAPAPVPVDDSVPVHERPWPPPAADAIEVGRRMAVSGYGLAAADVPDLQEMWTRALAAVTEPPAEAVGRTGPRTPEECRLAVANAVQIALSTLAATYGGTAVPLSADLFLVKFPSGNNFTVGLSQVRSNAAGPTQYPAVAERRIDLSDR